ncbi:MAG: ferrochelatase [Desulfobulbaceae bacterium]|nr:ferrochelatase [Desulfobulbaceae bacterium]
MAPAKKTGVLLLNLGGPEQPADIKPFLVNLFSDRQIIRLGPALLQPLIARIIAHQRAPKSMANYARIGGGSPILQKTREQARALAERLAGEGDFLVRPCMRYWHPFVHEVLIEFLEAGVEQCIALPLYPHYSIATTGSSLADLARHLKQTHHTLPCAIIRSWPEQPEYIATLARRVEDGLALFPNEEVRLIYSAHSLPQRFIEEGDPYVKELNATITALEKLTGIRGELCYQSRSGPVTWLGPSTPDTIRRLAEEGAKNLLILPISFVSDHVETLVEIDMDYRNMAQALGMRCASTKALNDDPVFIEGLAKMVLENTP